MINKYEESKQKSFIHILDAMREYWQNELELTQSAPNLLIQEPSPEDVARVKELIGEPDRHLRVKYPSGGIMPKVKFTMTSENEKEVKAMIKEVYAADALKDHWENAANTVRKAVSTRKDYIEESSTISQEAFDSLKPRVIHKEGLESPLWGDGVLSVAQLWANYKHVNNIAGVVDNNHAIEFAKLVRVMTIEETLMATTVRASQPSAGLPPYIPYLADRPSESIINLPENFKL